MFSSYEESDGLLKYLRRLNLGFNFWSMRTSQSRTSSVSSCSRVQIIGDCFILKYFMKLIAFLPFNQLSTPPDEEARSGIGNSNWKKGSQDGLKQEILLHDDNDDDEDE